LLEESIGIVAGSLPALRPLLSLRIRITTSSQSPAASGNAYLSASQKSKPRPRPNFMLDTFQTLGDNDVDHSDGDSQKNIIKETKYTVTSTRLPSSQALDVDRAHKNNSFV
jgi:hypothetical protein